MERVIDRFDKYMEFKGLNDNAVTRDLSFSIGLIGKSRKEGRDLSKNATDSILNFYIDLNPIWLKTGEGSMLKSSAPSSFVPPKKIVGDEVTAVPEDAYMMVEYADLTASAGRLGGAYVDALPDMHRRLVPREYEKGNYLVVRVSGDSMDDGTSRSLSDGDEVLIKQVYYDNINGLPIRNSLFVISSREGNVLKQIAEYNAQEGYMVCHSFNEHYKDFRIELEDVFQIFQVCKIVAKKIRL